MLISLFPFILLLCVHNSFKKFTYLGIYLMASNKCMFTSTFLNVSKICLSTSSIFLLGKAFGGKGRRMRGTTIEVEGAEYVEGLVAWASRFCWNCIYWRVIILTNSSNEVEDEGAARVGVVAGTGGTRMACVGATLCCWWGGGYTFWTCWFCCCCWLPHLKLGWFLQPELYLLVHKSWFF